MKELAKNYVRALSLSQERNLKRFPFKAGNLDQRLRERSTAPQRLLLFGP